MKRNRTDELLRVVMQSLPKETAQVLNQVAGRTARQSAVIVAKNNKLPVKPVSRRVRLVKATAEKQRAVLRINPRDMPAIRSGKTRPVKGKGAHTGGTRAGRNFYPGGFVQNVMYGPQILERLGRARYKIRVVKIPLAADLKSTFDVEAKNADLSGELAKKAKALFEGVT